MNHIRHKETSYDSLFNDIEQNLEIIYALWGEGKTSLRFSIAILCAVKLEAFINVAGKIKLKDWDIIERNLTFKEKCCKVFTASGLVFDCNVELNKSAVQMFQIRNAIVHPKMKLDRIDEHISDEEYERRSNEFSGDQHQLRSELTPEQITRLKCISDEFVSKWGPKLLDVEGGGPDCWLAGGSTGGFTYEPTVEG